MTLLKASTILICLATVCVISAYPVGSPQTAENKGRGRSYPLIISHYSNVRNSKYNSPAATEAPTTPAAGLKESDDLKVDEDDDDVRSVSAADRKDVEDESKKNEEKVQDETDEKNEKHDRVAPNMATDSAAVNVPQNESISDAAAAVQAQTAEDSLLVSKAEVVPSNENAEVVEKTQEPKLSEGSSDAAIKEADPTGTTLTSVQEEVQPTQTTSLIEADKPAALGESQKTDEQVKANPEMDIPNTTNAATADSVAKIEEPTTETAKEEAKLSQPIAPSDETAKATESATEQVKVEEAGVAPSAAVTPESTPVESSRTAVLATEKEKTSEFFEEDRSFKDRPEPELILAAIRQSAAAALAVGEEQKVLPSQIDDVANEGIRLQRDDNKKTTEKKEKEKEKYLAKPSKEKKPVKQMASNDPVQEYDDIATRSGKSKDDAESTTDTTLDKALTSEEPVTVGLVPGNYPVVLPDGESTLSHQIASADSPKEVVETSDEPSTTSLTPTNYPVVLPSGESTLSDKIAQEETRGAVSSSLHKVFCISFPVSSSYRQKHLTSALPPYP
ncbi:Uncharacterized protein APZ42_024068 [Daphnia magna]|uniref:Uncharacterized protein n=1 Tax=Daphnia magna TaxID=35525 RepID=A0A164UFW9_9CRUS|nr:Uncharacterized protein APZ42_024068 [Daphnia magna]